MSGHGTEWADQQAQRDYWTNPRTPKKESDQFSHYLEQQAYNARIEQERQRAEQQEREQQG